MYNKYDTITPTIKTEKISWRFFVVISVIIIFFLLFITPSPSQTRAAGVNLIVNPSLEQANQNDPTLPSNWIKGRWGTNTTIFSYLATGQDGLRSGKVQITAYTNGDAKWAFDHVPVTPGSLYQFSDYYQADAITELVIEYKNTSNVRSYVSLGEFPVAVGWTAVSKSFTVPAGMKSATVYHIIGSIGTLMVDNFSLSTWDIGGGTGSGIVTPPIVPDPPPTSTSTGNLISNPSVESVSSTNTSLPLDWSTDSWGTNTTTFTYPVAGQDGAKWLRVQISARTSGDAKWQFKHVPVASGTTYTFSDYYRSNIGSTVILEYKTTAGKFSYVNLGTLPIATSWTPCIRTFIPPTNAVTVSVLHIINKVGYLDTDNFTLSTPVVWTGTTSWTGGTSWSGNTTPPPSDTTLPTLLLTAPTPGNMLSWTIELRATATDNIGIASVLFSLDNTVIGSGAIWTGSTSSYSFLLDSTTLTNGVHTIHAQAIDTSNNSLSTGDISVTVNNPIPDMEAPKISIVSPMRWSILSGTSALSISGSDNVGITVVHYSITNGTDVIVGQFTASPYVVTIPADALKNGSHTITVYAEDAVGNIGNAVPVVYQTYYIPPAPLHPNLILNPSLEAGSLGVPDNWMRGGWGTNTTVFTYPISGVDGVHGAEVSMSERTDGDAKWYFTDVSVAPGETYAFSDQYKSTTTSTLTARYTNTDGTFTYVDIVSNLPASPDWIVASQTITIPLNATKVTIFHLINNIGTLDIDNAELRLSPPGSSSGPLDPNAFPTGLVSLTFDDGWGSQYDSAFPMLNAAGIKGSFYMITNEMKNAINANRIGNPSFEVADSISIPSGWTGVTTGTNTSTFSYPVTGVSSGKAAKVEVTSYTSGDARWQPNSTTVVNGEAYNFTDQYISNVPTKVTVVYTLTNDLTQTVDLGTVPASGIWRIASFTFTPPVGTKALTIYHRLISTGILTTDDYHVDIAQDYMNLSQIRDIYNAGHEVSAHTRTHPFLTQLTSTQATSEISGSRQDMLTAGFTPADTFVYPYGDYSSWIIQMAKDAGYIGARSVDQGYNTQATDKYALMIQEVNSATTAEQWESWTQTAMKNRTWLILMFHQIDHQIDQYGATPEDLQTYIDYLTTNGIPTVTMQQGIGMMHP